MLHGGSSAELCSKVQRPILLLPAGNDPPRYREDGDIFKALHEVQPLSATIEFPSMVHGWVPRGDISDPLVKHNIELAISLSSDFFERTLSV